MYLGRWPVFGNPDPKDLEWAVHHPAVALSVLALFPTLGLSVYANSIFWRQGRLRLAVLVSTATVLLWFFFFLTALSPVGEEFLGWYLD